LFSNALKQFSENLDTLREFTAIAAPYLIEKREEESKKNAKVLFPIALAFHKLDPANHPLPDGVTQEKLLLLDENIEIKNINDEASSDRGFQLIFHDNATAEAFHSAIKKLNRGSRQIQRLYDVSLISLISTVEWFLSTILHEYFDKFPDAVEGKEKVFSLLDLKLFDTIEHARTYLVDTSVENILRGSFEDWLQFLKNRLKLSCGYLDADIDCLTEAFQRRNLLVHNGGIVNNIYLAKVSPQFREDTPVGIRIQVDPKYLDKTITLFESSFLLVAAELWKKIDAEDDSRSNVLIDITYDHLVAERWDIAKNLSYFTMNDAKLQEFHRLVASVNYWQSLKWQGRFNEVRDIVKKTDFSAKNEIFQLAQFVLLDDFDNFLKILPHAIESDSLPKGALSKWPLFREVRMNEKLKPYIENDTAMAPVESPSIRGQINS
jgi:hypothetical protein